MEIPNFWDVGPHNPLPVEKTWNQFIIDTGGKVISSLLHKSPEFENADYLYQQEQVVLELKEVETEFTNTEKFKIKFINLIKRLLKENPNWKPSLLGGSGKVPQWFTIEFVRITRPNISRILKKANRQIRDTKKYFNFKTSNGTLLFVNDGFTGITPDLVFALVCNILTNSYSSIDCFVYLTVNRYIEIKDSNIPRLVWWPVYSDRADKSLNKFINELGRKWFEYIEKKVGPFTAKDVTSNGDIIKGAKPIILPK
jgi:hypothetical protein